MPRHTDYMPLARRLAPLRRAAATAGVTAAALVVGVGGFSVATSSALAEAPGDRFSLADLLGGAQGEVSASGDVDPAAARAAGQVEADRSSRADVAAGLPTTSAEAQAWIDEVPQLEATLARVAAAEAEAARVAAEVEAARVAAEVEAARVAAEVEAARVAAEVQAREEAERLAEEAERQAEEAAEAAEEQAAQAQAASRGPVDPGSNRALGQSLMLARGFSADQWSCLDSLWQKESGWNHQADNPSSSAFGIPQALPGSKMGSAGADWETNPATQITWGLGYIEGRYGTPCAAWSHSRANNWY